MISKVTGLKKTQSVNSGLKELPLLRICIIGFFLIVLVLLLGLILILLSPALVIVFTVYQIVGFIKYRNKNKSKLKYYGKI